MGHKSSCYTYVKSFASFDDTLAAFLRHLATAVRPAFTL